MNWVEIWQAYRLTNEWLLIAIWSSLYLLLIFLTGGHKFVRALKIDPVVHGIVLGIITNATLSSFSIQWHFHGQSPSLSRLTLSTCVYFFFYAPYLFLLVIVMVFWVAIGPKRGEPNYIPYVREGTILVLFLGHYGWTTSDWITGE